MRYEYKFVYIEFTQYRISNEINLNFSKENLTFL